MGSRHLIRRWEKEDVLRQNAKGGSSAVKDGASSTAGGNACSGTAAEGGAILDPLAGRCAQIQSTTAHLRKVRVDASAAPRSWHWPSPTPKARASTSPEVLCEEVRGRAFPNERYWFAQSASPGPGESRSLEPGPSKCM